MADESVLVSVDPARGIGWLTLNRPDIHNAFNEELIARLSEALRMLEADARVRVVALTGAGRSFSAGADMHWMRRMAGYTFEQNLADARAATALMRTLDRLAKPTVAVVQGSAFGGGVGLVAACDMAIAVEEAQFSLTEVRLGLIPSIIGPYVLAAIGARQARRYVLSAERFSAAEARRIGLVHEVVPAAELAAAADRLLDTLAANGPAAMAAAKTLIADLAGRPIDDGIAELTAKRIAEIRAGDEAREGLAAFLEKRKAVWPGR